MRLNMEISVVIKLDLMGHSLGHLSENSIEAFVDNVRQMPRAETKGKFCQEFRIPARR